jgi:hypothetical protein
MVKDVAKSHGLLPAWVDQSRLSEGGHVIDAHNWMRHARNAGLRFPTENHVAMNFADWLLKALDDHRSVQSEVQAFRDHQSLGKVDRLITIGGCPVAVELKLAASATTGLVKQIRKYALADRWVSRGVHIRAGRQGIVLLIDGQGVYVTRRGRFEECNLGFPYLPRTLVTKARIAGLRRHLKTLVG